MKILGTVVLGTMLTVLGIPSFAQDWSSKPVRIISPFSPGGGSDTIGRLLATQLTDKLGKQFLIENRAGAGGLIGTAATAKSEPGGYTFVISSIATHVIAPGAFSRLSEQ